MKQNLFGSLREEIASLIEPYGVEGYRAKQIAEWMYRHGVDDFAKMKNLPQKMRDVLAENFLVSRPVQQELRWSGDRKTAKFLLRYPDGAAVETVLMRQPYGNSVCVSSQVGCAMGCRFCASTLAGLERNLTGGEMLAQVLHIQDSLAASGERVASVVVMGGGEPMANLPEVLRFMRLCHDPDILNMGYRSFTISTCGLVPGIRRLQSEDLPVTLSISLHAPNDEIRSRIMPVNERYPMAELVEAGKQYADATKRRVTYEYALISGVNDRPEHARELAAMLRGSLSAVNLIPLNAVAETGFDAPAAADVNRFETVLEARGIQVTVRREMGADIDAACGQLRQKSQRGGNQ